MIKSGKIWPIGIGISFILIVILIVGTIKTALDYPVEKSNEYMRDYHETDKNANELITNKIAFDKNYNIEFLTDKLDTKATVIKFKITDKNGNIVDNAKISVVLTRPDRREFDMKLTDAKLENGVYVFDSVSLPKEGRWNIISEIVVDKFSRYYNLKSDTRKTEFKVY
jgi:hypothetical protein